MEDTKAKLKCKLGILSRPDGSALLAQGDRILLAAIYGPTETKGKILIDKANVEVCYRPKSGLPGVNEKIRENAIQNICEVALAACLYPRASVVIVLQELGNTSGELTSCAVNAAWLALFNSGIEMNFMVAAANCILTDSGELLLSSDINALTKCMATFVFAFESLSLQIIASETTGLFTFEQYQEALELCKTEAVDIIRFYKSVVAKD